MSAKVPDCEIEPRFWARVGRRQQSECWPWMSAKDGHGYGAVWHGGKLCKASRVAWSMVNGSVPPGMCVCHACDNPACCNPAHLWLGSHRANMQDMVAKGRCKTGLLARPGEASPNWKLTDEETAKVRELFESGLFSKQEIADIFEVTRTLVYLIVEKGHRANV